MKIEKQKTLIRFIDRFKIVFLGVFFFLSFFPLFSFDLKSGDLLFQNLDGPYVDAIEECTSGINGWRFSHVGIVFTTEPETLILEAGGRGVTLTKLSAFLKRSKIDSGYKTIVGRIKETSVYHSLIPVALRYGKSLLGKPFDPVFELNNGAYYCAELIYEIFKFANSRKEVFKAKPMNFKSLKTGKIAPIWIEYFKYFSRPVPQGKPGVNPADFTKYPFLQIFTPYNWP